MHYVYWGGSGDRHGHREGITTWCLAEALEVDAINTHVTHIDKPWLADYIHPAFCVIKRSFLACHPELVEGRHDIEIQREKSLSIDCTAGSIGRAVDS
jgi:hypothetical protein